MPTKQKPVKTKIIDGRKAANEIEQKLQKEIAEFQRKPSMAVVLVGDDVASQIYVNHKKKAAEKIGMDAQIYHLSPVMTQDALIAFIEELNRNDNIDGIIVQLPLPKQFDTDAVIEAIHPDKDIDGLHYVNLGRLFVGQPNLVPCTPMACMFLLKKACSNLVGKNVVVVGRSRLVGKPLVQLLLDEQCTVTQAHSKTKKLADVCRTADVIISATGHAELIGKKYVRRGAILIDVGIVRTLSNKIVGDMIYDEMIGHAGAITPVPGGVGPMTVAMLLANVVKSYRKRNGLTDMSV